MSLHDANTFLVSLRISFSNSFYHPILKSSLVSFPAKRMNVVSVSLLSFHSFSMKLLHRPSSRSHHENLLNTILPPAVSFLSYRSFSHPNRSPPPSFTICRIVSYWPLLIVNLMTIFGLSLLICPRISSSCLVCVFIYEIYLKPHLSICYCIILKLIFIPKS